MEGAKINRSLLALANCINALGDKNKKEFKVDMETKVLWVVMEFVPTAEELIRRKISKLLNSRSFKILIKEFN